MRFSSLCTLALSFLLFTGLLPAQVDRSGLNGLVTDATGAAVGGAKVEVQATATGFRRATLSGDNGIYQLPALPVGVYSVTIGKEGFSTVRFEEVQMPVGINRTLNAQMQVGALATQVEVRAETTPLEQTSAEIGSVIAEEQIRNIPLNGRHWASLMLLAPGAVNTGEGNQNSIRFFGRARDDNNWTFDGIDATGVKDPRQEGNLRLVISLDSIAEFKVNSTMYGAEGGAGAGAQINLVSKTGTNAFHGSVFEFLRNDVFDARRPFDGAEPPPFRLNQFGGNLGGPIVRDRTFFYANYEGLEQRLAVSRVDGLVPSASFRAQAPQAVQPILAAYPTGTRPTANPDIDQLVDATSQAWTEHSGMARIDHRFNDRHSIFGRFSTTDGFISTIRNALLETRDFFVRPTNATVQYAQILKPTLINEVKLGVNRSALFRLDLGRAREGFAIPGFTSTQPTTDIVENPTSYSVIDNLSWVRGRHTVKAGFEARRIHVNVSNGDSVSVRFASRDAFLRNSSDRIEISGALPTRGTRRTFYLGYLQDEVKLTPTLTMNAGVRYEYYTVMNEVRDRAKVFDLVRCQGFCAPGSPFYFPDRNNFAPRLSFAWAPAFLGGKTVIRTGYGIFYGPGQNDDVNAAIDSEAERFQLLGTDAPDLSYPVERFLGRARSTGLRPRSLQRDRRESYAHQWTFAVQKELAGSFVAQAAYVGSTGHHLFTRAFINVLNPVTRQRPLPQFSQLDEKQNYGRSSFNGLQASLQRAFARGLLFQGQYMWSNSITDNSGSGEGAEIMIPTCRVCDRGPADADIRHTATFNSVYQLPFGKGRRFGNAIGGFGGGLIGGWDLSGLYTARTGRPFSVTVDRSSAAVPSGQTENQRPNLRSGTPVEPVGNRTPDLWLNPSAFAVPSAGTYGDLGRNAVRGPGLWQLDLALIKRTRITERSEVEFRAEAFNLFNRAQYGNPVSNISNPNFGRILTTANDGATGAGTSRQLQFMLRLNF